MAFSKPMAHAPPRSAKLHHFSAASHGGGEGEEEQQSLLPGLPDHLAERCLAGLPPPLPFAVCRGWRRLLYSPSFPPFLSLYALLASSEDSDADPDADPDASSEQIGIYCYDPIAGTWEALPPPPPLRRLLLRHPSFVARSLPVQSVSAGGHLVLVAATAHRLIPALPRPIAFHPSSRLWLLGPPLRHPRRWCAAGSANGSVYVASGVGEEYSAAAARSAERWDPRRRGGVWEAVAPLRDGRFSREPVEAVASRGRLCLVNLRGRGAKDGAIYRLGSDRWEEMPSGMRSGWTGPAGSAEDDPTGPIYVADEQTGTLKEYVWESDTWKLLLKTEKLKGASGIAAGGRRICVACGGGTRIVIVDVATRDRPPRTWVTEPPQGKRVVAIHILPRMALES